MPGGKQENIQNVTNQTAGVVPPPPKKVVQPAGGNIFDELKKTVEEKKKRQKSSPNAPEAVKEGQKGGQPAANDGKPTVKKQGPPLPLRNSQSSGGNVFDELKKSVAARNKKLAQSSPNLSGAANKEQPAVEKQETAKKKTGKRIPVDVKGKRVTPPPKKVVRSAVLPTSSSESASDAEARKKLFSELINKKNSQLSSNASGAVNKQEITEKKTSTSSTSSSKSVSDDLRTSKADLLADNGNDVKAKIKTTLKKTYQNLVNFIRNAKDGTYSSKTENVSDEMLERIYGEQGGLKAIYKLENAGTKKKSGSAYGKYSLKICNSYDPNKDRSELKSFFTESGKLAVKYLSSEGKTKMKRLKKVEKSKKKEMKGRDLIIDAYKLLLMCMVAVCSTNQKHVTEGRSFYEKNSSTFNYFIAKP